MKCYVASKHLRKTRGPSFTFTRTLFMTIDFSSRAYWRGRLRNENETGFEWLVPSSAIINVVSEVAQDTALIDHSPLRVLHFGCGSSTLGSDIQQHLGPRAQVTDADYASASLRARDPGATPTTLPSTLFVPLFEADVMDLASLRAITPPGGWHLMIDKSTADAISCSAPISVPSSCDPSGERDRDCLDILCDNLGAVAAQDCRWISVSYSSSRFDFLTQRPHRHWAVLDKFPVQLAPTTSINEGRVVYQPQVGTWVWILGRR